MAINQRPETRDSSRLRADLRRSRQKPSRIRWRQRLVVIGVIGVLATAAALIADAMSSPAAGPRLTHTITRGDLLVTITEQGILESSENTKIKCKVRGHNTVIWVVESGTMVQPGDELVRLDTLFIEEQIDERTKYAHWSRAGAEYTKTQVARAELLVAEYEQGTYLTQLMTQEKSLVVAESKLIGAKNILSRTQMLAARDYASELIVEEKRFALEQAKLDVELKKTQLDVLKQFTKKEQLKTLTGDLVAGKANHEANAERAMADASRRDRAIAELEHCVVKAPRSGLVIHPAAAQWENAPEIAEGVNVYKDQVLLLMPDLSKMQVKVGIHESAIDRVKPGLTARVTLPNKTLQGTVNSVASVTKPSGWWTGNVVKYDTIIELPSIEGLRPGMSAEVEVLMASHKDVLKIPVAAIVETEEATFCWVKTAQGTERRSLELGDSNDIFTVVESGLKEGDEVMLNPLAFAETRAAVEKTVDETGPQGTELLETELLETEPQDVESTRSQSRAPKPNS